MQSAKSENWKTREKKSPENFPCITNIADLCVINVINYE